MSQVLNSVTSAGFRRAPFAGVSSCRGSRTSFNVGHVEKIGALHGENVTSVVEILVASPAEFLHDDILSRGNPYLCPDRWRDHTPPSVKLGFHERIVEQLEKFHAQAGVFGWAADVPTAPSDGVELDLCAEDDIGLKTADDSSDRTRVRECDHEVHVNPHFPALRSDALALSGASRRKQIGGLSGSRLLGPLHEQIDRGGTGGPW